MSRRASRARRSKHKSREFPDYPVDIWVGSRQSQDSYQYLRVSSPSDAGRFEALIDRVVHINPLDPILLVANGYQPWLEGVFRSCLDNLWSDRQELNREAHFADTLRFPENTYRRLQKTTVLPWSFIIDQINVPDVYFWTFREMPPDLESDNPPVDEYRFRMGVWTCSKGAYVRDRSVPVTMIFLQNTDVSEHLVTELLFPYMYDDRDYNIHRSDEASLSYIFLRLFDLLTDWENIIREFEGHLEVAEKDSRKRFLPVKFRARIMHNQIDRIYELLLYLRFHTSCFKKLAKLKSSDTDRDGHSEAGGDQDGEEPVWDEMNDMSEELDQANYELDALKERFSNLTDLEFSIENASQSENTSFLTVIATLFLPLSYLASIWGISTFTGTPMQYLYAAIPVLVTSALFVLIFPAFVRLVQRTRYPEEKNRLERRPQDYSMLGDQLPSSLNAPETVGRSRVGRGKPRRSQTRKRSRSAAGPTEKRS